MNQITVKNANQSTLKKVLIQLADMYIHTSFVDKILVYSISSNHYQLEFPNQPDFMHFQFFVNYLKYPENLDSQIYNPEVFGIWKTTEKIKGINALSGELIGSYISSTDTEYDNVHLITKSGMAYQYGFDGKIKALKKQEYAYQSITKTYKKQTLVMEISPSDEARKRLEKPWWKFW